MRRVAILAIGAGALAAAAAAYVLVDRSPSADEHWALVDRYCAGCHNGATSPATSRSAG